MKIFFWFIGLIIVFLPCQSLFARGVSASGIEISAGDYVLSYSYGFSLLSIPLFYFQVQSKKLDDSTGWVTSFEPLLPIKRGEACAHAVLGFASGDSSIETAKRAAGVKTVQIVQFHTSGFPFVYARSCTEVFGN